MRCDFAFDYPVALPLAGFGVLPGTSYVQVQDGELLARFGPWSLRTPVDNVVSAQVTGPYRWWRAVGLRLSLGDSGVTFGSNARRGLLLTFAAPVDSVLPWVGPRHPNATLTVADPEALRTALARG